MPCLCWKCGSLERWFVKVDICNPKRNKVQVNYGRRFHNDRGCMVQHRITKQNYISAGPAACSHLSILGWSDMNNITMMKMKQTASAQDWWLWNYWSVCVCVRMHACVCEWLENAQQVAATNLSIRNTGTDIAWYMISAWTCACHPSEQPAAETAMFHWTMSWMTFPTASDNHGVSHYNMMRHSSPLMNLTPLVNAWSEF